MATSAHREVRGHVSEVATGGEGGKTGVVGVTVKESLEMFKVAPVKTLLGWFFYIPGILYAIWFAAFFLGLEGVARFTWDLLWYWIPIDMPPYGGFSIAMIFIRGFLAIFYSMIGVLVFWQKVDEEVEEWKRKTGTRNRDTESDETQTLD